MTARGVATVGALLLVAAGLGIGGARAEVDVTNAQYAVKHTPYLQLGDAPLTGYPRSSTDQVRVMWQTVPVGSGTGDSFVVEYRPEGAEWLDAGPVSTAEAGVGGRVIYQADLLGLAFEAYYEYRVQHLRGGSIVATYGSTFRTRLPPASLRSFTFAAYGDSAYRSSLRSFRLVQERINRFDPDFSLLLGDNAYDRGTHGEVDARFDAALNPEATEWNASHIDYVSFGNHDVASRSGRATEHSFSVPVPVAGLTAPAAPPESERAEHNYSFDYGSVHFVTFDTNSLGDPIRLAALLNWVTADLLASRQPWKIVFGHHPVAGTPDKGESPSGRYYRTVVPALFAAGVDAFMVGHSHTYGWSYPLTGEQSGVATFVRYRGRSYRAGDGVVQVVSGVGGASVRSGSYARYPFMAAGYTSSTKPRGEFGFTLVEVTPTALTFSYIAADDGGVIDSFTIPGGPDRWGVSGRWPLSWSIE